VVTYERIIAAQAALKYVELNGDEVPRDLSRLNIFVPIPINLSDPFSGELLKTIARNRETVVYSVGPDGVDDYSIQSAETSAVSDDILLFR